MTDATKMNLSADYVAAAPYGDTGMWVVGWVFSSKAEGEKVMRDAAGIIRAAKHKIPRPGP